MFKGIKSIDLLASNRRHSCVFVSLASQSLLGCRAVPGSAGWDRTLQPRRACMVVVLECHRVTCLPNSARNSHVPGHWFLHY